MRPTSVKIVGQTFAVEWRDTESEQAGHCSVSKQVIGIDSTLADDQQKDTLVHELVHGGLRIMGAGLSESTEERVASILGPVLLDVLRSNPQVVKWLLA